MNVGALDNIQNAKGAISVKAIIMYTLLPLLCSAIWPFTNGNIGFTKIVGVCSTGKYK